MPSRISGVSATAFAAEQARVLGAPREYLGCGQGANVENGFDYPLDVASDTPHPGWQ